jgi:hypothetical protein
LREAVLRVSVWDKDKKVVERFCREFAPIITSGPPGISGYAGSRPKPRPVLAYWPTTVDRKHVRAEVNVMDAGALAATGVADGVTRPDGVSIHGAREDGA